MDSIISNYLFSSYNMWNWAELSISIFQIVHLNPCLSEVRSQKISALISITPYLINQLDTVFIVTPCLSVHTPESNHSLLNQ